MSSPTTEHAAGTLLAELIAIPSINPALRRDGEPPGWFGEERLAHFVADWLRRAGAEVVLEEVEPGRPNVVARLGGRRGPRMIWEGHLDTVQVAGMTVDPFGPVIRDGRIYGRGAVDDKGCLAMFMLAMARLASDGCPIDLTFLAAVDEETTFRGVLHHIARHPPYDFGIAGEPTDLGIVSACKGVIRWRVTVGGRAAHTSTPQDGIDAGALAMSLVAALREAVARLGKVHPLLGRPTLTCTRFEAGEGPNTVPARAELAFDYRILPDRTGPEAWEELAAVARCVAEAWPEGATLDMQPPFIDSASMEVAEEDAIVQLMQGVCRRFGRSSAVAGVPFGSDATKLTRAGTPTIVFGPGSIAQAHTADESVALADVAQGADMLIAAAHSAAG